MSNLQKNSSQCPTNLITHQSPRWYPSKIPSNTPKLILIINPTHISRMSEEAELNWIIEWWTPYTNKAEKPFFISFHSSMRCWFFSSLEAVLFCLWFAKKKLFVWPSYWAVVGLVSQRRWWCGLRGNLWQTLSGFGNFLMIFKFKIIKIRLTHFFRYFLYKLFKTNFLEYF